MDISLILFNQETTSIKPNWLMIGYLDIFDCQSVQHTHWTLWTLGSV